MKKKCIQRLEELRAEIHKSVSRWNYIVQNGCSDPFWPDGCNLNLVRNHIIYERDEIINLCEENGLIQPDEAFYDLPPKVPNWLYIGDTDSDRYRRVSSCNNTIAVPCGAIPEYDPFPFGQQSLF